MAGTDHAAAAEDALNTLQNVEAGSPAEAGYIGEAQVHATLALKDAVLALVKAVRANGRP